MNETDRILLAAKDEHEDSPIYRILVLDRVDDEPEARLDGKLLFLSLWRGWHPALASAGAARALEYLPDFLARESSRIRELRRRNLLDLENHDFETIRDLAEQLDEGLRFEHRAATAWGKLLHLLAPSAVMMWDATYIRGPLRLEKNGGAPGEFVALQRWVQRWVRHVAERDGAATIGRLQTLHQIQTQSNYSEPVTKILDEALQNRTIVEMAARTEGWPMALL